ncbi:polysaccharide biosynthesis tyrosine autokinase [Acaryochloris sp. IP29b_bin.137]|uniref:GumC family protein n=1 Tax=Acaryochloris sp. IP29b_bin.137 TaxID=2969217 RepID=UPI00263599A9|nr:polysaccharide biosynthesis tyrosine autokinase [Acaryochloris sp. IP29b_bin.137]
MTPSPNSRITRLQRLESAKENPSPALTLLPQSFAAGAEEEGGLNLGQLLGAIRRRLPIVVLVTAVVAVGTLYWSRTRPSSYKGEFRLLIEPVTAESEVVSAISGDQPSVESQELGGAQASETVLDYPTQIQILLSPQILEPVVRSLHEKYPELTYEQLSETLKIQRVAEGKYETKILSVEFNAPDEEFATKVLDVVSKQYIKYSIEERQTNLGRALEFLDKQLPKVEGQVRQYEGLLQQFREKYQLLDPATFGGEVSTQAGAIQGQLAENQIQLMQTRQMYTSLQQQLQLSPSTAEAATVLTESPSYQKLRDQLQDIESQLAIKSAELTSNHPEVVELNEQRNKLLPLINQAARNSLGRSLSNKISDTSALPYQDSLRKGLSKQFVEAAIQLQVLEAQRQGILGAQRSLQQKMGQLPGITRQYETLQRKLQIANETYRKFLEQREQLLINSARNEVPWEMLGDPAIIEDSSASLPRDLVLGTILGLLLGVGIAILLDKTNDAIHSLQDLRAEVNRPILGIIPFHKQLEESPFFPAGDDGQISEMRLSLFESRETPAALTNNDPQFPLGGWAGLKQTKGSEYSYSPFLEAFRSLYSQLHLLNPDVPVSSLVISSCSPQEGKSTTSIHLAQSAAAMGRKVLLVDADLRAPSLSRILDLPNSPGLSDLMATEGNLQSTIHPLPGSENLFVLTAGMLPSDPTRILACQKMQKLMGVFDEQFDLVIYDCPPLNLADSTIIAPQTDGLMVVAHLGSVPRSLLKESLRMLEIAQIPILGVVANGAKN